MPDSNEITADWPDTAEVAELREQHYNATVVERIDLHDDLARFRIRPDGPIPEFSAGQYVALGLGNWESRLADTQAEELKPSKRRKLVRRAYSISCPLWCWQDERVLTVDAVDYLEFYIVLVRRAATPDDKPPGLTPRLFGLRTGDRMAVAEKITGQYRLGQIDSDGTVLMLGTGTGEAPHNAMAAQLLADGHRGRIVIATSSRLRSDLGYRREHQEVMRKHENYQYLPLTTREPENVDQGHPGYVGKQYLQSLFQSGELARLAGDPLSPDNTHVFLCGNPAMIGYVPPGSPPSDQPGMLPLLRDAGFVDDEGSGGAGTIRFEKYW